MSGLVQRLLDVPGWTVLVVTGAVVFAEDAFFIGFVIPGETVAVLAGVAAKLGHVSLTAAVLVVVLAAIAGDSVGYLIGRRFGQRVLALRILDKRRARLAQAEDFLARRGGTAVFLGRRLWVLRGGAGVAALGGGALTGGLSARSVPALVAVVGVLQVAALVLLIATLRSQSVARAG
ncbi:DedA family protein [Modestobacter altitudinis]|uniref:DedA family protein n=1 Tax=Modestobacter altitudinis TaxID=2213158 RepID=UPI00110CD4A7|nr:VTT domain-containing protein [Modestobacter altitudinis]